MSYKTPGVYVEEISLLPPSVAQVETAIPAFIGYTEQGPTEPTKITSMLEYENIFGGPRTQSFEVGVRARLLSAVGTVFIIIAG